MSQQNHGVSKVKVLGWRNTLLKWTLSDELRRKIWFRRRLGRWPNLSHPQTLNEHVLHRVFYEKFRAPGYIDKAAAKDKVAKILGPNYVPQRYLLTENPRLPWDTLPQRFVVSATHGSGMTMVVGDKASLDKAEAEKIMAAWLAYDFAGQTAQPIYRDIKPRLLVEENISAPDGTPPADYKFLCFGGEPRFIQLDIGRYGQHLRLNYDTSWQPMPYRSNRVPTAPAQPRPKNLGGMVSIARTLSQGFDYVRVDLYQVADRIVFGEWTFLPGGGTEPYEPESYDYMLGNLVAEAKEKLKGKRRGVDIPLDETA